MEQRVVTIIGGTGFVGRYVVKLLAAAGYTIRVVSRHPDAALPLKTAGNPGQIVLVKGDITKPSTLAAYIEGSYAVINLAGVLFESGKQTFTRVHSKGVSKLAQMAKAAGVQRFVHVSALGVDKAVSSKYARSKLKGELAILEAFPEASILRPSVIFGPEDNFFNQFAAMACFSPVLPLFGGGKTKFQPVYVGDVARAIATCVQSPYTGGHIYELGGPGVFTFREILEYIMDTIGKERVLAWVPYSIGSLVALVGEVLPRPPLTRDQIRLLKNDNVVSAGAEQFAHLGISPTAVEMVVPDYLDRYRDSASRKKAA